MTPEQPVAATPAHCESRNGLNIQSLIKKSPLHLEILEGTPKPLPGKPVLYLEKMTDQTDQPRTKSSKMTRFQVKKPTHHTMDTAGTPKVILEGLPTRKMHPVKCHSPKGDISWYPNKFSERSVTVNCPEVPKPHLKMLSLNSMLEGREYHHLLEQINERSSATLHYESGMSSARHSAHKLSLQQILELKNPSIGIAEGLARFGPESQVLSRAEGSPLDDAILISAQQDSDRIPDDPPLLRVHRVQSGQHTEEDFCPPSEIQAGDGLALNTAHFAIQTLQKPQSRQEAENQNKLPDQIVPITVEAESQLNVAGSLELSVPSPVDRILKIEKIEESYRAECSVCCAAVPNTVCYPCGHGGTCSECIQSLKAHALNQAKPSALRCLICKEYVQRVLLVQEIPSDGLVLVLGELKLD